VDRVFSGLQPMTRHLLDVVIDKNREDLLSTVYEEYRNLWDESRGIIHAEVQTAFDLTDAEEKSLVGALSQATGRTVEITVTRDKSLVAGVRVRIGDRVLDGSLARRLAVLGDRLRSTDGGGNVVEH
jgi:F-type H+-transporting ATPase subunit delta